jgi:hypothetical protein
LYLRLPWAWRFFGAQFFIVGKKLGAAVEAAGALPRAA